MICHALVATFMLNSPKLVYKDLQFLDYCPARPPVACQLKHTTEAGVRGDVKTYVWCADADGKVVYKGNVAEMIRA